MKNTKRTRINLIFSSFLVIGYIICTYFFSSLSNQVSGTASLLIQILMLLLFGLLLFYATRVGEGVQVKRFSAAVLLLIDIPSLYIILATFIDALPFHDALASQNVVFILATIALGYGIPYTFVSGYEIAPEEEEDKTEDGVLEGGLAEELAALESEDKSAIEDEIAADSANVEDIVDAADAPDDAEEEIAADNTDPDGE